MKTKNIHTSLKLLSVWCIDLTWFDKDEEYSHELESFNLCDVWIRLHFIKTKSTHTSPKVLTMWDLDLICFDERKDCDPLFLWFGLNEGFWSLASLINLNFFERTSSIFARSSVFLFLLFCLLRFCVFLSSILMFELMALLSIYK